MGGHEVFLFILHPDGGLGSKSLQRAGLDELEEVVQTTRFRAMYSSMFVSLFDFVRLSPAGSVTLGPLRQTRRRHLRLRSGLDALHM